MSGPFQVMPPLSDDEYADLRYDIARNGITVPVVYDQHGRLIDGHHRLQIAAELGIENVPQVVREVANAQEARSIAYALNLHRRHLSREAKRELLAASIKADPGLSDRQHGERVGADHKTAGAVRAELEATGEIPQLSDRCGADGRTRPAKVTTTTRTSEATKTDSSGCLLPAESPSASNFGTEPRATGEIPQLSDRCGADGRTRPAKVTTTTRTSEATKVEHDVDPDTGEIVDGGIAEAAGRAAGDVAVLPTPPREPTIADAIREAKSRPFIVADKAIDRWRQAYKTSDAIGGIAAVLADADTDPFVGMPASWDLWLADLDRTIAVATEWAAAIRRRNLRSVK